MKLHKALVIFYMVLAVGGYKSQQRAADPALQQFAWLTGTWMGEDADGTVTEEVWTTARGGTMFGINRIVNDGETAFYEYLCIQRTQDGIYYLASPKGKQPLTPFKLVPNQHPMPHPQFIFENAEHDFPQQIMYRLHKGFLTAEISGMVNGEFQRQEWKWRKVRETFVSRAVLGPGADAGITFPVALRKGRGRGRPG